MLHKLVQTEKGWSRSKEFDNKPLGTIMGCFDWFQNQRENKHCKRSPPDKDM